jgi:hypothetical protein
VIVAVVSVRVVQVAFDEIVGVVAVRDGVVAAVRAVAVARLMPLTAVLGCARVRMARVDGDVVLVDVPLVRVVEMAVVQVVDVPFVQHCRVPAVGAMHMLVVGMGVVIAHEVPSLDVTRNDMPRSGRIADATNAAR